MTTTSRLPLDDETREWREMPFLGEDHKGWSTPTITGDDMKVYTASGVIGIYYALNFIGYLVVQGEECSGAEHRLSEIVSDMIAAGPLGGIEKSFLSAVAEFIATGRVLVAPWFDAVPIGRARENLARRATEACQ